MAKSAKEIKKKKPTSFSLSETSLDLLKQLADKESRSITNMLEMLIKEAAIKNKLKVD